MDLSSALVLIVLEKQKKQVSKIKLRKTKITTLKLLMELNV